MSDVHHRLGQHLGAGVLDFADAFRARIGLPRVFHFATLDHLATAGSSVGFDHHLTRLFAVDHRCIFARAQFTR